MGDEVPKNFPNADLAKSFLVRDDIELIRWLTKDYTDYRHRHTPILVISEARITEISASSVKRI